MDKLPRVYIPDSRRNGTLYVGVASSLISRVFQHRNEQADGFTKRHGIHQLVWYEVHECMESVREKI